MIIRDAARRSDDKMKTTASVRFLNFFFSAFNFVSLSLHYDISGTAEVLLPPTASRNWTLRHPNLPSFVSSE